jgi:hypothetical protein
MALDQFGEEILGGASSIKLRSPFTTKIARNINVNNIPAQVIFATAFEHEFYTALTTNKSEFRFSFFDYMFFL